MRGLRPRLLGPEAGAMRHLIEAVPERLRAGPDRLEQDLVVRMRVLLFGPAVRRTVASGRVSAPGRRTRVRSADGRHDRGRRTPEALPASASADGRARRIGPGGSRGRRVRVPRPERRGEDHDDALPARSRLGIGGVDAAPRHGRPDRPGARDPRDRLDRRGTGPVPAVQRPAEPGDASPGSTGSPAARSTPPSTVSGSVRAGGRHGADLLARHEAAPGDRRRVAEGSGAADLGRARQRAGPRRDRGGP